VDLQTSDHDKNSTSTDAHVSRRDGINNNNNWEVNDYELQPSDQIPDPDNFGLSSRATHDSNNVLEQY